MAYNGPLPQVVQAGGTGDSTLTAFNLLAGNGSSPVALIAPSATSGIPLVSNGSAANSSFSTALVAGGGTGTTTFPIDGAVFSGTTTTSALSSATLATLQVLAGNTAASPAAKTLTAGTNITITDAPTTITIASTGGGGVTQTTGSFTPSVVGQTTAGTTTYSSRQGSYVLTGNMVHIECLINISSATGTGNALLQGSSLPFPINGSISINPTGTINFSTSGGSWTWPAGTTMLTLLGNPPDINFWASGSGASGSYLQMGAGQVLLNFSFDYFT